MQSLQPHSTPRGKNKTKPSPLMWWFKWTQARKKVSVPSQDETLVFPKLSFFSTVILQILVYCVCNEKCDWYENRKVPKCSMWRKLLLIPCDSGFNIWAGAFKSSLVWWAHKIQFEEIAELKNLCTEDRVVKMTVWLIHDSYCLLKNWFFCMMQWLINFIVGC